MTISKQDFETLEKISRDLPKAIRAQDADANAKFSKNASFGEKAGLIISKLRYDFTSSANPEISPTAIAVLRFDILIPSDYYVPGERTRRLPLGRYCRPRYGRSGRQTATAVDRG